MKRFRKVMVATPASVSHIEKMQLEMFRLLAAQQYRVLLHGSGAIVVCPLENGHYDKMKRDLDHQLQGRFREQEVLPAALNEILGETIPPRDFNAAFMEGPA